MSSRVFAQTAIALFASTLLAQAAPVTVIIDPGHGGEDTGARKVTSHNVIVSEKELTLGLALETAKILRQKGLRVFLTREKDEYVELNQRTAKINSLAKKHPRSIFVSIHTNSSASGAGSGIETYVFNATTNEASSRLADLENGRRFNTSQGTLNLILTDLATTANYAESVALACEIQQATNAGISPEKDRGVRQALFYVLMESQVPSVLFEAGFLSNPRDLVKLTSTTHRAELAQKLARGIISWSKNSVRARNRKQATMPQFAARSGIRKSPCVIK